MNQESVDQLYDVVSAIGANTDAELASRIRAMRLLTLLLNAKKKEPTPDELEQIRAHTCAIMSGANQKLTRLSILEAFRKDGLTAEQLRICEETGCSPESFRAMKASRK